ncbi:unnamed protein product [Gadus morhua 'NCC']
MMADREYYTEVTRLVPAPPTEAKPPGLNPRYPCGARLPWLAAPAGGSNERVVLRPPTEAKPPGLNPRYPRGARLPRLAVAEVADGQEAWIQAAHSDTVSPRARALGAASSQETSPGRTPPEAPCQTRMRKCFGSESSRSKTIFSFSFLRNRRKCQSKKKCDAIDKSPQVPRRRTSERDTEREERGGVGLSCHHMTPRNRRVAAEEEQFSSEVEKYRI